MRYENGETAYALGKLYPVTKQGIEKRAKKEGWLSAVAEGVTNWLTVARSTDIGSDTNRRVTPEKLAGILQAVAAGAPEGLAAQAAGFRPATLSEWKADDPSLANAIATARSQRALKRIDNIEKAGDRGDWKASAYGLERDPLTREAFAQHGMGGGITIVLNIPRDDGPAPKGITIDAEP